MSKLNIGGLNLDSNEIIDVTCTEMWYKKLLEGIGGFIMLGFIVMIISAIFDEEIPFWKGTSFAIVLLIIAFFFVYLSNDVFNHSKITVKTMSSGEIKIHTKVFDEDDSSDYYEELKTYI